MSWLNGKKTYLVAVAMIAYAAAEYWTGAMMAQEAVQFVLNGLGLGALRRGIANS